MKLHKATLLPIAAFAALLTSLSACNDKEMPSNPVVLSPISGLVIEVNGEDYTALPVMTSPGTYAENYLLDVKIPNAHAKIVQISLADPSLTPSVKAGDEVTFNDDNLLDIALLRGTQEVGRYTVEMRFNPPPFYYFVKSSDTDTIGNRYYLDRQHPTKIASATYDNRFEGEADLTASNWDNIGLVSSDLAYVYDLGEGPWPAVSSYSYVPNEKAATDTVYFKTEGPWNDWLVTNGNPDIVSPGVWRVNFDSSNRHVDMTMTQWAVNGAAVGSTNKAMTYASETRSWSFTGHLNAGTLRFVTIPVTFGDPTFDLGRSEGISELAAGGDDIVVPAAGNYRVTLTLSNSPYYTYSVSPL